MSQDFTENKRYLLNFNTIAKTLFVLALMIISFCAGQHDVMRTAKENGHAIVNEEGNFRWKR